MRPVCLQVSRSRLSSSRSASLSTGWLSLLLCAAAASTAAAAAEGAGAAAAEKPRTETAAAAAEGSPVESESAESGGRSAGSAATDAGSLDSLEAGPGTGAAASEEPRAETAGAAAQPVEVTRVHRPELYEVRIDGSDVPLRLPGIEGVSRSDEPLFSRALDDVRAWIDAGPVRVRELRRNEHGEIEGRLRLADGAWLAERAVAAGWALVDVTQARRTADTPDAHETRLREAQRAAREQGRGIWGQDPVAARSARTLRDRIATLCGDAARIVPGPRGDWLVHLGPSYRRRELTIRVPAESPVASRDLEVKLRGHDICVTGRVRARGTGPEVLVRDMTQIEDRGGR